MSNVELIARLLLSAALGSAIGFERERLVWAAGLRTHMLVCVGSCLLMIVSAYGFSDVLGREHVVLDPSRIAAQVVSGIGFLGAGTILLRGEMVKGLTTAASLWGVAAIGLAVGGGLYVASGATTLIILGILAGLKPIEDRFRATPNTRMLTLKAERGAVTLDTIHEAAGPRAARIRQFVVRPADADTQGADEGVDLEEISIAFVRVSQSSLDEIATRLRGLPGVRSVAEERVGA